MPHNVSRMTRGWRIWISDEHNVDQAVDKHIKMQNAKALDI